MELTFCEEAYQHNIHFIQSRLGQNRYLLAVVKSDAYGLGMLPVCSLLMNQGVRFFAVYHLEEALLLQQHYPVIEKIVILGRLSYEEKKIAIQYGFDVTIHHMDDVYEIAFWSEFLKRSVCVHMYFDTGMGSMGMDGDDLTKNKKRLQEVLMNPYLVREGLLTHMSLRDPSASSLDYYRYQLTTFKTMRDTLGLSFRYYHTDNSSAFFINGSNDFCNMIRPGMMLHGLNAQGQLIEGMRLPFSLSTHISLIKKLSKGDKVNYNREWSVTKDMNVGVLPVGYGDGLSLQKNKSTFVWIKDQLFPVVGSTNMNNLFVDLLNREDIQIGDKVFLMTTQTREYVLPFQWCTSDWSSYQLLSSLKHYQVKIKSLKNRQPICF